MWQVGTNLCCFDDLVRLHVDFKIALILHFESHVNSVVLCSRRSRQLQVTRADSHDQKKEAVLNILDVGHPPVVQGLLCSATNSKYAVGKTRQHPGQEHDPTVENERCYRVVFRHGCTRHSAASNSVDRIQPRAKYAAGQHPRSNETAYPVSIGYFFALNRLEVCVVT